MTLASAPRMNAFDIVLTLVIVAALWGGWVRGFVVAAADLLALFASVVFSLFVYPYVVVAAQRRGFAIGVWTAPLAFLCAYALAHLVLELIVVEVVRGVPRGVHLHPVNRAFGVLPGAVNGLIAATVVAMLALSLPLSDPITRVVGASVLANRFSGPAEKLEARLKPIFNPAIDATLTRLTINPGSHESVKLPFTVKAPKPRADLEADMLILVNEERAKLGLKPLQADPQSTEVARAHSKDMFARGYFSHVTPEGEDPFARLRHGGVRFLAAGENLAYARTLKMAHEGLMHSPGHRANILRPAFGRVGIGIEDGGRYGLMVTQAFRN